MSTLGQRLEAVRKREKLPQGQFAERLGYSRRAVHSWEKDQVDPPTPVLVRLREEFDVDPEWLLLGNDLEPRRIFMQPDWNAYDQIQSEVRQIAEEVRLCLTDEQLVRVGRVVFADGKELVGAERDRLKQFMRAMALER
jgi:transcriptional regulator with XRE-family HTH domain